MNVIDDLWMNLVVSAIAILALPFYMGYLHSPFVHLLLYAAVAGVLLASAEHVLYRDYEAESVRALALSASLRGSSVLLCGGIAFVVALWLV